MVVGWLDRFMSVGKNVAIGLLSFAVFGSLVSYYFILFIWRIIVSIEWRRRRRVRAKT